jgi:5-methyltetrahydrofolate corrinoid/iron sulfur protein methyltransferase
MIAIGERINGMFLDVKRAIADRNKAPVEDLAKRQTEAGAAYLDINVGTAASDQQAAMQWLIETVQAASDTPLAIDSQKWEVIEAGLKVADPSRGLLLNSTPLNKKNDDTILDRFIEAAAANNASIVALTMDKNGVPQDVDTRVMIAAEIVAKAAEAGLSPDRLFIDPIILPVNCDQKQPTYLFQVMDQLQMLSDPAPHMTVGLSNISQGTSQRSLINRTFLVMAAGHGLDSAIVDVLDTELMDAWITADMLANKMIYSDSYLRAARA